MDNYQKSIAHIHVSIMDASECIADLAKVCTQGLQDTNGATIGNAACGLRRAAWRLEKGTLEGWSEEEENRLHERFTKAQMTAIQEKQNERIS